MTAKSHETGLAGKAELGWTVGAAVEATAAALRGNPAAPLRQVVTDSRKVGPGDLFVALRGERFDGHAFVPGAWAAGAAAVLVEHEVDAPADRAVLTVGDSLAAYGDLARWWRRQHDVLVVGVTGSTGKSSTKELVATVLEQRWTTLANRGSFNNEIGLPATLLELDASYGAVVLELAMRGAGQIDYLARIAEPRIGVITNIGTSHVGLLGSREAIAAAKGELLEHLGGDGVAVLNADDPHLPAQAGRHRGRVLWYGRESTADIRARDIEPAGLSGSRFKLLTPRGSAQVRFALPGLHMVSNALAAAAAGYAAGLEVAELAAGLEAARRLPLRLEVVTLANGARVINDAYNAAPDSVRAALQVLGSEPARRRIACLGDMLELGDLAEVEHLRLGHDVAAVADVLITVGELGAQIAAGARDVGQLDVRAVPDAAAAGEVLAGLLRQGDLVLLKGSRAVGLERALEGLERT